MNARCFQISDWILVVEENKLYSAEREVMVEPRLINLLSFLAEAPGEVFGRETLIENIWDGAIVTDQVVTQSIFELRKTLKNGRSDCAKFIATVPKRGYKLVADTRLLTESEVEFFKQFKRLPNKGEITDLEQNEESVEESISVFPAAPLTRAVTVSHQCQQRDTDNEESENSSSFFKRHKFQFFDLFLVSALIIIVFAFTYVKSAPAISRAMDTQVVEFSYHSSINSDVSNEYLADGISQKFMSDVQIYSDYRVQLKKTAFTTGILPGKVVNVRIESQQGQAYLDIQYKNNSSNRVIFSRQYPIGGDHLYQGLNKASADLLKALNIPLTDDTKNKLMDFFPASSDELAKFMKANHYTNQSDINLYQSGIALFDEILITEPNNSLVLADRYIAYSGLLALDNDLPLSKDIKVAGEELARQYNNTEGWPVAPRVYEALSLKAILDNDIEQAKSYIDLAGKSRRSALYYIILGKVAELEGFSDIAGDAYTQAFFIDTSIETYRLTQNIAFYSDLETVARFMYSTVNRSSIKLL